MFSRTMASREITEEEEDASLPSGWHKVSDGKGTYFRNKLTGECQGEVPTTAASLNPSSQISSVNNPDGKKVTQASIMNTLLSPVPEKQEVKRPLVREVKLSSQPDAFNYYSASMRGFMYKQLFGGLMNRWRKVYLSLSGTSLEYFKEAKHFRAGVASKPKDIMQLTASTILSYDDANCCFKISSGGAKWVLMTCSKMVLEQWMRLLSEVIKSLREE
jgi:hypothetical protein